MGEDYKKIALEDVKKGQRIHVVERHSAHTVIYEGAVLGTSIILGGIDLGEEGDEVTIIVEPGQGIDFDILLLEDVPKPKVVRTEKVTITYYDDGTKTETPDTEVWVPMVIETMEQFEEYEAYLKKVVLKDAHGDYWTHQDGQWHWTFGSMLPDITWNTPTLGCTFEDSLPMTVVENVGD